MELGLTSRARDSGIERALRLCIMGQTAPRVKCMSSTRPCRVWSMAVLIAGMARIVPTAAQDGRDDGLLCNAILFRPGRSRRKHRSLLSLILRRAIPIPRRPGHTAGRL